MSWVWTPYQKGRLGLADNESPQTVANQRKQGAQRRQRWLTESKQRSWEPFGVGQRAHRRCQAARTWTQWSDSEAEIAPNRKRASMRDPEARGWTCNWHPQPTWGQSRQAGPSDEACPDTDREDRGPDTAWVTQWCLKERPWSYQRGIRLVGGRSW